MRKTATRKGANNASTKVDRSTNASARRILESLVLVHPGPVQEHEAFALSYLADECFSKFSDGSNDPSRTKRTWDKFHECEASCRRVNSRLTEHASTLFSTQSKGAWSLIQRARQKIEIILGDTVNLDEVAKGFDFGPGATTRLPRSRSSRADKFSGKPETTIANAPYAEAALASAAAWQLAVLSEDGPGLSVVPGNRVVTVPKNNKIDRMIAIEPCMNIYVQKGFGAVIRRRLARAGLDLSDQSRNQRLARVGSIAGTLATIDLSSASDCISIELVRALLPGDWFEHLNNVRSHYGVLPCGSLHRYHKFSSMGNGFTFELETLIFYALALAVSDVYGNKDSRISVYGDDIIVPTSLAEPLISILDVCGFTCNAKKTFVKGPFRESCGKHWYRGLDVSPFYVRRPVSSLDQLFLLANNLLRWSEWSGIDKSDAIRELRQLAPANWRRPRIPDGYGDGAFIGPFDAACPKPHPRGWDGYVVSCLVEKNVEIRPTHPGRLLASLHSMERQEGARKGAFWDPVDSAIYLQKGYIVRKCYVPRSGWGGWHLPSFSAN